MSVIRLFPVLALAAVLGGPLATAAQTPPPASSVPAVAPPPANPHHHHRHHQSLLHALRAVNLTDAQKQQVAAFHDQEKQANLNAGPAAKEANAATMRRQIMSILTPDQKAQLTAAMHRPNTTPSGPSLPNPAPSPGS